MPEMSEQKQCDCNQIVNKKHCCYNVFFNNEFIKTDNCPHLKIEALKGKLSNEECDSHFERERADQLQREKDSLTMAHVKSAEEIERQKGYADEYRLDTLKLHQAIAALQKELTEANKKQHMSDLNYDVLENLLKKTEKELEAERGKLPCDTCEGSGVVWIDGGQRNVSCPDCNGTGRR